MLLFSPSEIVDCCSEEEEEWTQIATPTDTNIDPIMARIGRLTFSRRTIKLVTKENTSANALHAGTEMDKSELDNTK